MTVEWRRRARSAAPYAALSAIAAIPAFYLLGERGFWGDEVWEVWWSRLFGWREILNQFDAPPDLPLSFWMTKAANLFGESTFSSRLPSALMGIGSVLLLFHIGRRQLGTWTAFGAATLLAVAPLHVWYEQEARPYGALEFLSLLSLAFLLQLMERPTVWSVIGFSLSSAATIYDHLFGIFPVAILVLSGFVLVALRWVGRVDHDPNAAPRKRIVMALTAGAAITLALLIPILPGMVGYALDQGGSAESVAPVNADFVQYLLGSFGVGLGWPIVVLTGLFAIGAASAIAARKPLGIIATAWIVLPIVVLYVASPEHGLRTRYLLFMLPIYLLMAVHGILASVSAVMSLISHRTTRRLPSVAVVSSVLLAALLIVMLPLTGSSTMALRGTDWSGMCEYLHANAKPGDVIIGSEYYNAAMSWCFNESSSVVVTAGGGYTPEELVATGRPSWYVQIDLAPIDPQVLALGYIPIEQGLIERPGTRPDPPSQFPYPVTENGSRLFRGPAGVPPASIEFHDHPGREASPDWPDFARVSSGSALPFALASHGATSGDTAAELTLSYVNGPGRTTVVLVDGIEVARLDQSADTDTWETIEIPLPTAASPSVRVEIHAAGAKPSVISSAAMD